jgi:hypothetical protein
LAARKSDKPPSLSAFDALWNDVVAEREEPADDDLPPALAPQYAVTTGGRPPYPQAFTIESAEGPEPREEDRATLTPPVPPSEYVEEMMRLGDLADLDDLVTMGKDPPYPAAQPGRALAPEHEVLHEPVPDAFVEPAPTSEQFPGPPRRISRPGMSRVETPRGVPAIGSPASTALADQRPAGALRSRSTVPQFRQALIPSKSIDEADDFETLAGLGPLAPEPAHDSAPTPTGLRLRSGITGEARPSTLDQRALEMRSLLKAGSYSSALVLAESVLGSDPSHAGAKHCAEQCRVALGEKYLGSLGGRQVILRAIMGQGELTVLSLDHRAGFLLSFIDGSLTIDEVLDACSMPELDALRILFELRTQGVIGVEEPARRPRRR